jgi:succinoglycan biosynthesis protein ExoA
MYRSKTARHHPIGLRSSHVLPPGTVLALAAALLAPRPARPVARLGLLAYAGALAAGTVEAAAGRDADASDLATLPLVYATMHLAWGSGFLVGCLRFGPPVRALARVALMPRPGRP